VISKRIEPLPDDTPIVPPWASTIDFVIASPSPAPSSDFVREGSIR
jgi:hypothetical protein